MAQGRSTEIITMIKWIRTSRLSIKELSLSVEAGVYQPATIWSNREGSHTFVSLNSRIESHKEEDEVPWVSKPAWQALLWKCALRLPRYRGTSLTRNNPPVGPYSRVLPRALRWSMGGGQFLMGEEPLYDRTYKPRHVSKCEVYRGCRSRRGEPCRGSAHVRPPRFFSPRVSNCVSCPYRPSPKLPPC